MSSVFARSSLWPAVLGLVLMLGACAGTAAGTSDGVAQPPRPAPPLRSGLEEDAATPASSRSALRTGGQAGAETGEPVVPASAGKGDDAAETDDLQAAGGPRPLGEVAGQPVFAEELLLEWNHFAPREIWLVLDKLVATRLAFAEAQRIGLRLDPALVERRVARERSLLDDSLRDDGHAGTLEERIVEVFAQQPEYYLARLREATIRQMIAERAVRAWTLSEPNVRLRLIVVPSGELADTVEAALADGADFAELAREHSIDDTAPAGGLVPYLVRQERSPLARIAFDTPAGAVGGPTTVGAHVVFVLVEERREPQEGDWAAVGPAVEASLATDTVRDAEFLVWKLTMERRYPVDLTDAERLLGAPQAPQ